MSDGAPRFRGIRRGLVVPFVAVLVLCVVVIATLAVIAANGQDRIAIDNSIHLARSVLADYQRRLAQTALGYSYWDEAVENLVTTPDPGWAEAHGGRMWATANRDSGTAFHFTLPGEASGREHAI
jgi:sensor domain CHASE-containing protein